MSATTIRVSEELADELYKRKSRGESYEDVIWRLLDDTTGVPSQSRRESDSASASEFASVDFPNTKSREECIEVIEATRDYLEQEGSAKMRDIVRDVMSDHSLGYEVPDLEEGERYRGAWWRKIVRPGLQAVEDVEQPASGQNRYRYVD